MARDDELLNSCSEPCLRLYSWLRPTLSLGYSQSQDWVDHQACERLGVEVVRRPTGGRALLHLPSEITYAVVLPDVEHLTVREAFEGITGLLLEALQNLGIAVSTAHEAHAPRSSSHPSCLEVAAPGEVIAQGRKLVGSAQVRRGTRLLQHGAIPRYSDQQLLEQVIPGATTRMDLSMLQAEGITAEQLAQSWRTVLIRTSDNAQVQWLDNNHEAAALG